MENVLTSDWGQLSPHLLASFWECDREGKPVPNSPTVSAPLSDITLDMSQNWQSPFEDAAQSTASTFQQLFQTGTVAQVADYGKNLLGIDVTQPSSLYTGRSSVTKLNSTQVWSGSAPIKISFTVVFRAWSKSTTEVEDPVNQLMRWSLPKYLQSGDLLLGILKAGRDASVMPSKVPSILSFKYKNRTYTPMVIESIGVPLSSPIDKDGNFVELSLPITLCGLHSIDAGDWDNYRKN